MCYIILVTVTERVYDIHRQKRERDAKLRWCGNDAVKCALTWLIYYVVLLIYKERILEILNTVDAKSFLIWAALKERDKALDSRQIKMKDSIGWI